MCQDDEITQDFPSLLLSISPGLIGFLAAWVARLWTCVTEPHVRSVPAQIIWQPRVPGRQGPILTADTTGPRSQDTNAVMKSPDYCTTLSLIQSHKSRLNNLVVTLMKLRGSHTSHRTLYSRKLRRIKIHLSFNI